MEKLTKINYKEKMHKGITLIALVITIIVLLILVGISIATLTGENGILTKANKAKEEMDKATAKEKVQMAIMGSYGTDGRLNYNELKNNLDKVQGITNVPSNIDEESFSLEVNVDGYKVIIEKNGDVTVEGEKTGEDSTPTIKPTTIEQAKEEGKVLDKNNPTTLKDKYENKIVVPEGFKIASDSAEDVTGGVVIEDVIHGETAGSQFVWVPVGEIVGENEVTKTIKLSRYYLDNISSAGWIEYGDNAIGHIQELATSDKGNTTAKNLEEFKTSVIKNGGYYIGRYEAGDSSATANRTDTSTTTQQVICKQGQYVYNYVTQPQAADLSRNMYKNQTFTSDLVNSYAWDAAIVFIQEFSKDLDYSSQSCLQRDLTKTGEATDGTNKDVRCNIYDMAGNTLEWSTETNNNEKNNLFCVSRGGTYRSNGSGWQAGGRHYDMVNTSTEEFSFRIILYL